MRPFGTTGKTVSELSLGTWGLSGDGYGPVPGDEVRRVLDRALELGVNLFDTADVYGDGAMETLLGARLPCETTTIVTKLGTVRDAGPPQKRFDIAHLRPAFERSRERQKRDRLDVVLLHNPSTDALRRTEAFDFLRELKGVGALGTWGVSAGSADIARAAILGGAEVVEVAYNVFVHTALDRVLGEVGTTGFAVLVRSVLAHGLLGGTWTPATTFGSGDHRHDRWTQAELAVRLSQVEALRPMLGEGLPSIRAAAVRFVLANRRVASAVVGPRTVAQLDELVKDTVTGPPYLRDTEQAELRARLRSVGARS
jgi:aryl-alcohol dehydrogenase-like predicted oxidoreductase